MKIAIVKLSALGDIVHAMAVLQFIKKYNQEIEIDWIVEEGYKELLESNPNISKVYVVNIKKAKLKKSLVLFLSELKKIYNFKSYDMVIDMQGLVKSAIIARLIPSKLTCGFDKYSSRESLAAIFYNKKFNLRYDENVVVRNFELIKFAIDLPYNSDQIINKKPLLFSNPKYLNTKLSNLKKNIILIPGASHSSKRYPLEKFAKLTNLIDANYIVIWGNKEEKVVAEGIKDLSPNVSVCKKIVLKDLISLVSLVDLVIGSDTGPTHLAWAQNVPSITLFGPTPGNRNTYITKINKIIESSSKVNPFKINKNDISIKDISVEEIKLVAQSLLV